MRTCKETTELLTKASYSQLSLTEWLSVRLHLMLCRLCRSHKQQTEILSQATRKLLDGTPLTMKLSDATRQRIRRNIEMLRDD